MASEGPRATAAETPSLHRRARACPSPSFMHQTPSSFCRSRAPALDSFVIRRLQTTDVVANRPRDSTIAGDRPPRYETRKRHPFPLHDNARLGILIFNRFPTCVKDTRFDAFLSRLQPSDCFLQFLDIITQFIHFTGHISEATDDHG